MNVDNEAVLVAIAKLEEKNENLERYVFKELKPEIANVYSMVQSSFKWMMFTMVTFIVSTLGLIGTLILLLSKVVV